MFVSDAYRKLMNDPVWGRECELIANIPHSIDAGPAVVGGAVRDLLMDRKIKDLDIATSWPDTARDLAVEFANVTRRRLVEYTHEQAIYRVVAKDDPQVDFTDPVGGDRESDLVRRDFTCNALALELTGDTKGELIDPTRGQIDIEKKIVRMTSAAVFTDDPLRLLRAFRFASQLGFKIDDLTLKAISENANRLRETAGERVQLELCDIFGSGNLRRLIESMDKSGVLHVLFPELSWQKGMDQNDYHHLDVWGHTLEVVDQMERIFKLREQILVPYRDKIREYLDFTYPSGHSRLSLIKLASLLHDIAKPHCRDVKEDGRVTFIGHERKGAELVREHMTGLKFAAYEREFVGTIIEGHLRPMLLTNEEAEKPRMAYRFFRDFGDAALAIILLSLADRYSAQGVKITSDHNERHVKTMAYFLDCLFNKTSVIVRPPQLVDGATLMHEFGLEPGPIIGLLLRRVQEAQVMNEIITRDDALEFCRKIISSN